MTTKSKVVMIIMGLGSLLFAGCATLKPEAGPAVPSAMVPLRVGDIIDTERGALIDFNDLMSALSEADVVFVGETHVSATDHQIQYKIASELFSRRSSLVLALEMLPREAQGILDRYSSGELPEDRFLKEVDWENTWGFPFSLYRPILGWAASKHLPIIGLNAPREVVRKVSRGGLASLSSEDRSRLAVDFDLTNWTHRKRIEEEFSVHTKGGIRDFEAFYGAQLAWEETMAETLARTVRERKGAQPVLVLVGKGHIEGRSGVPERAVKRFSHRYKTVMPVPVDYPESVNDPRFADFVWITGKASTLPPGRLGVLVRPLPSGDGLEVVSIHPSSPADRSGVKAGDIITTVNGQAAKDIMTLHRAVAESSGRLKLRIRRNGRDVDVAITLDQTSP
ncbi:MAG: ChaN family lipoprotein [Syntrophobacteraceae bacterium]